MNNTVGEGYCGECGEVCEVYAEVISWDYAGTHCNFGKSGTHYAGTEYASKCCDATAYTNEELTVEFDGSNDNRDYDGPDTWDEYWGIK